MSKRLVYQPTLQREDGIPAIELVNGMVEVWVNHNISPKLEKNKSPESRKEKQHSASYLSG